MNDPVSQAGRPRALEATAGGASPLAARAPGARRPYLAPRVESGAAFERVQLASGCNDVLPGECDPVC